MKWNKVLSAAAAAALALSLVACGGSASTAAPAQSASTASESVASEASDSTASEAASTADETAEAGPLANADMYELTDLTATGWQLCGGMGNGTELDDAGLQALAEQCGGVSGLIFPDESSVQYITGDNTQDGVYAISDNVAVMQFEDDNTTYACFLTKASDESPMLVMLTDDTYSNALYFSQIDEG